MFEKKQFDQLGLKETRYIHEQIRQDTNRLCFVHETSFFFYFDIVKIEAAEVIQVEFPEEALKKHYSKSFRMELSKIQAFLLDYIQYKSPSRLRYLMEEWIIHGMNDALCIYDFDKYEMLQKEENQEVLKAKVHAFYLESQQQERVKKDFPFPFYHVLVSNGEEGVLLKKILLELNILKEEFQYDTPAKSVLYFENADMEIERKRVEFFAKKLGQLGYCINTVSGRKRFIPKE